MLNLWLFYIYEQILLSSIAKETMHDHYTAPPPQTQQPQQHTAHPRTAHHKSARTAVPPLKWQGRLISAHFKTVHFSVRPIWWIQSNNPLADWSTVRKKAAGYRDTITSTKPPSEGKETKYCCTMYWYNQCTRIPGDVRMFHAAVQQYSYSAGRLEWNAERVPPGLTSVNEVKSIYRLAFHGTAASGTQKSIELEHGRCTHRATNYNPGRFPGGQQQEERGETGECFYSTSSRRGSFKP